MINYFCPDADIKSGGIRRIYRHVDILHRHGFPAFVVHSSSSFKMSDVPAVPVKYLDQNNVLQANDFFIIPEGFPGVMEKVKDLPLRRFVFALSWSYIFPGLHGKSWRDFNIERVMAVSPVVAKAVAWAMQLPVYTLAFSIDHDHYYPEPQKKTLKITYNERKATCFNELKAALQCHNPELVAAFEWVGLGSHNLADYARELRESQVYLALSTAEALNRSVLEAMSCGTWVAGFNGIGLKDMMIGRGLNQNAILAENGDYLTLAQQLAPLLQGILDNNTASWQHLLQNGIDLTKPYTIANEEESILQFWADMLAEAEKPPQAN